MKKICINGITFAQSDVTGVERYVYEIVRRLDRMANRNTEIFLLCPKGRQLFLPELINIKVITADMDGYFKRIISVYQIVRRFEALYIDLTGSFCAARGGIGCIHDIRLKIFREYDPFIWRVIGNINFWSYKLLAKKVVTVSESSKDEICTMLKMNRKKVSVIYSGWDHMKNIEEDLSFWDRHPEIQKGSYYYTAGSIMYP